MITAVIDKLQSKYPQHNFRQMIIPPLKGLIDNSYGTVVSFQVIEHIKEDLYFLEEIYRVLRPGGKALITTPNIKNSISRNPWHVREYTADELMDLAKNVFSDVKILGITGNEKVMSYYEENRKSVNKIMRWDLLNLQHRLPASLLKLPYELLNRLNRNKLNSINSGLVSEINHKDYILSRDADSSLDLFCILTK